MKKIFFVTYGGVHANIDKFVIPKLSNYEVSVLALTLADNILKKAGIAHKCISDYLDIFEKAEREMIVSYGKNLAKSEFNPNVNISIEDCVAYLGIGFNDLVGELESYDAAYKKFENFGRKAFCPIQSMQKILKYEKPDLVVLTVNVRYERATGIAANLLHIPVLYICDLPEMERLDYDADICVMNEYAKKYLLNNKVAPDDKIHVTGQPVIEDNTRIDYGEVRKVSDRIHRKDFLKLIVYLEQPLNNDTEEIELFLKEMAEKHPENLYISKLHPNQNFDCSEVYILNNYIKTRDINLKALLYLSDLVITKDSNSGLEAAMMNKNLIVVGINDEIQIDFSQYGIALRADSLSELKRQMDLLQNENIVNKLEEARKQFRNVNNSANNIKSVMDKLLI